MAARLIAACVTPRGAHGEIDFGAMFELIDFLSTSRVDGVALFTAAGEYPALTLEERSRVAYLAVKRSRVPILIGIGSASLDSSVELGRQARDAGASALLAPPPYFFEYDQSDLVEFYSQLAAQIDPRSTLYVCNTPSVTSAITIETASGLISTERFAGMIDASGELEMSHCLPHTLVGDDAAFTEAIVAGAEGAVSELASAAPELMLALTRAIASESPNVKTMSARVQEFAEWTRRFPAPAALHAATAMRGLKTGRLSTPLTSAKQKKLEEFREWMKEWLVAVRNLAAHA